jgi:hypothetical protein
VAVDLFAYLLLAAVDILAYLLLRRYNAIYCRCKAPDYRTEPYYLTEPNIWTGLSRLSSFCQMGHSARPRPSSGGLLQLQRSNLASLLLQGCNAIYCSCNKALLQCIAVERNSSSVPHLLLRLLSDYTLAGAGYVCHFTLDGPSNTTASGMRSLAHIRSRLFYNAGYFC